MIVLKHLRINILIHCGDIMSESLLPHMASYNDQQVIFEMEKQIRELQRLIDVNEEIDRLELESEINEIKKEHDVLVDIMAHDYVDQLTNPDNPSFGIVTTQDGGTYGIPPIGEYWDEEKSRRDKKAWEDKWKREHGGLSYQESGRLARQKLEEEGHGVIVNNEWMSQEDAESSWGKVEKSFEFGVHISKHHGDDQEITQTCEDCGMVFSGDPFSVNEESMDHVVETGHTTFNVDKIGDRMYHESLELPLEPMGALLITKTREWWDVQNYDDKLTFLSQRFIKAGELAKARWIHLPSHVKDSILSWVDRNSITEKFKSRKQQQWYHATDQTFYDDEPHENRKVEGEAGTDLKWGRDTENDPDFEECPECDGEGYTQVGDPNEGETFMDQCIGCNGAGVIEITKESKTSEGIYDPFIDQKSLDQWKRLSSYASPILKTSYKKGDYSLDGDDSFGYHGRHLDNLKKDPDGKDDIVYSYKWQKGGETDDIDWTEDKPDETPFYCPLCAMVIEETATYDGVSSKETNASLSSDSETLAKGFTYSNSPPTSEESKAYEKGVLGGDLFSHGIGGVWDNISSEGRHKLISMNIYEFLDPNDVKLTTQVLALEETGQNLKWDEIPSDVRRPLEKAIIAFAEKLWLTRE